MKEQFISKDQLASRELAKNQPPLFMPATTRGYIPREGFYSDRFPPPRYQLSVNPRINIPMPIIDLNSPVKLDNASQELNSLWHRLLFRRQSKAGIGGQNNEFHPNPYDSPLPSAIFSPTSEDIFTNVIVPAAKAHFTKMGTSELAVNKVGYILPFWSQEQLQPFTIVEGDLQEYIRRGAKLPGSIGAAYIDFPSTVHTGFTRKELIDFIRNNPSVLFIVDQANLYFSKEPLIDVAKDMILMGIGEDRLFDNDLVFVTNTTSKTMGKPGCALAAGTRRARALLESLGFSLPQAVGFDEAAFIKAKQALSLESRPLDDDNSIEIVAFDYRQVIAKNKKRLESKLEELFGYEASSPEFISAGANIFINAESLGFTSGQEMCDYLYANFSIATKSASVYTDSVKYPEFKKYVYMAVPTDSETIDAVFHAFEKRHEELNAR